jgi:hypothetical protein
MGQLLGLVAGCPHAGADVVSMRAAEAARSDRLGKSTAPKRIEPLSGVLAKILERREAVVQR